MAVITTNLPMLSPLIQTGLRAISSNRLRSWLAMSTRSRRQGSGNRSSQTGDSGTIRLEAHSSGKQRGREPKSLYHITALSESEERIMGVTGQSLHQEMIRERDEATARNEESGRTSQLGVIQQQVEVTVTREPSTLSPMELEQRQMFGYLVQAREDVGTSATCHSVAP